MSNDTRSPSEIERDLERNRLRIDSTISALQDKFSLGEIVDQVVGYARNGPGEFGRNFGIALRDNPLPVAMIGIGIGWLALGGGPSAQRPNSEPGDGEADAMEQPSDLGQRADRGNGAAAHRTTYRPSRRWTMADDADEQERRTLSDRLERTRAAVGGVSRRVGESVNDFVDRLYTAKGSSMGIERNDGESAEDFSTRVDNAVSSASERLSALGISARQKAHRLGGQAAKARDRAFNYFEEQPLVIAGLGLAVGAALAAALPPTQREDEFMGEQRDRLRDSAADAVGKAAQRAEEVGRSAVEKAGHTGYPESAGGDDETDAQNSADKSKKGDPAATGTISSVSSS